MSEFNEAEVREALATLRALLKTSDETSRKLSKVLLGNGSVEDSIAYKVLAINQVITTLSQEVVSLNNSLENLLVRVDAIEKTYASHMHELMLKEIKNAEPNSWPSLLWRAVKANWKVFTYGILIFLTIFSTLFFSNARFRHEFMGWLLRDHPQIEQTH